MSNNQRHNSFGETLRTGAEFQPRIGAVAARLDALHAGRDNANRVAQLISLAAERERRATEDPHTDSIAPHVDAALQAATAADRQRFETTQSLDASRAIVDSAARPSGEATGNLAIGPWFEQAAQEAMQGEVAA